MFNPNFRRPMPQPRAMQRPPTMPLQGRPMIQRPGMQPMPPSPYQRAPNYGNTLGASGAAGMALSDEHSKQKIAALESELATAYRAMGGQEQQPSARQLGVAFRQPGAYSYAYKDPTAPGAGPGRFAGPMAQELEGIPGVVRETPAGKAVDTPRLTMANTSEVANQRREIDDLKATVAAMGGGKKPAPKKPRGSKAEGEIAKRREEIRARDGAAAAAAYEREAMARLRGQKGGYVDPDLNREAAEKFSTRGPYADPDLNAEEGYAPIATRKGRNIPMRNLDEPAASPRAPRGTQFSDEISQEDEDAIVREFFDPSDRYRTFPL